MKLNALPGRLAWMPTWVMLALVALIYGAAAWPLGADLRRLAELRVEQDAAVLEQRVQMGVARRIAELRQLARGLRLAALDDRAALRAELEELKLQTGAYAWLGLTDPQGQVLAASHGWLEGSSLQGRPVYERGRQGSWFGEFHPAKLLRPYLAGSEQGEVWVADVAAPVFDAQGRLRAVLVAHLNADWLQRLGHDTLGAARQQQLGLRWALQQADGRLIGKPAGAELPQPAAGQTGSATLRDAQGQDWLVAQRGFDLGVDGELRWRAQVGQDLGKALAPVHRLYVWLGGLALATLLLGGLLANWLTKVATQSYAGLLAAAERRAEALQRRFAVLVNNAHSDAFVMLDAEGRVRDWSQGAVQLTGWASEAALGRPLAQLLSEPAEAEPLLARLRDDGQAPLATRLRRADGGSFIARGRLYRLPDDEGGLALIFSDATRDEEAAQRLADSEARLAGVIAGASDAVISTDVDGKVLLFNPAAERIFGVAQAEMLGQPLDRLLPPSERAVHPGRLAAFAQSEITRRPMGVGKVTGLRSDGQQLVLEAAISAVHVGGRKLLTAILRDVTERDRAEQRLVGYQLQLTELTQRLLAQEKETTRRLAQVLHDELGQTLAALRLMLDAGLQRGDAPPWVARLDAVLTTANRQVREVLTELRPPLLDDQGLRAALHNELQQQQARHEELLLRLDWPADRDQRWPAEVEYAAFMVAREALGNALRHAKAQSVTLSCSGDAARLRLSVDDDGVGDAELASRLRPGHLGLVGMRERALAIGARLDIESSPQSGTTVTLSWEADEPPLPD